MHVNLPENARLQLTPGVNISVLPDGIVQVTPSGEARKTERKGYGKVMLASLASILVAGGIGYVAGAGGELRSEAAQQAANARSEQMLSMRAEAAQQAYRPTPQVVVPPTGTTAPAGPKANPFGLDE